MKNNSGRPRKIRHVGPGGKAPRCGMCTWGRKEHRPTGPSLETEQRASECQHTPWDECPLCWNEPLTWSEKRARDLDEFTGYEDFLADAA